MFKPVKYLDVFVGKIAAGKLALTADNLCVFEYSKKFIESGFSISPFYIPLKSGVFTAKPEPFNGLFGVFNDSLPDGWGKLLIDRLLVKNKINPHSLTPLDRLAVVGQNGMGAIEYRPESSFYKNSRDNSDINYLAQEVKKILSENYSGSLELLAKKGGSSGGARPKVLVNIAGEEWLVKFPSSDDVPDIGKIEFEYSLAAKDCGIKMTETKIFEGKYFGTKRFDRVGKRKIHMHSAAGLLQANYRLPSLDYVDLFNATLALTGDMSEAMKIYRLMVFNVLTNNRDDHAKNFSFIYYDNKWQVSPAYDLVFSYGFNGQHTTTVNGNGLPNDKDIFAAANAVGIKKNKATQIFDEIKEKTKSLQKYTKLG